MKVETLEGVSEEDFACSSGGREVEMDEAPFEGETPLANSPSQGSAKPCRIKSSEADITITPCKVLLKNIDCELSPLHKYCLIPPKTKKLPQTIRNAKKMVSFKRLQAGLYDLLEKHCIKRPGNPPNPATLPENKKLSKMESSAKILSKETDTDDDVKNAGREATLCDNVFPKFSFIDSNPENSAAGFCHAQENKKEAESSQEDPVLIPETQNTVSFELSERCMEQGNTLIEQRERKESSPQTGTFGPKCSRETSTDCSSQPSRMIPIFPGETLQTSQTNSAGSSVPSLLCEFEPYLASSLPGSVLKGDLKDESPRKNTVKIPVEGRRNQDSLQSSAEVVIQEQVTAEKLDALNQTRPMPRKEDDESCWFELEGNEVADVGGPVYATCEISQKMQNRDHSSDIPPLGCQSLSGDVTNSQHSEVRKEIVLHGREIIIVEEHRNSQPAKGGLSGEEDRLLFRQSQGAQKVFYKLSGSSVKLLGTPRESSLMLCLDKLMELEDSSDSEYDYMVPLDSDGAHQSKCDMFLQGSSTWLNKENEGSPYSTELTWHQPLYSANTRAIKRSTWNPSRRPARIRSSKLSQEESRIKVVDALREVLQQRLDDSPDLSVPEDTILRVAKKVEKALFNLSCCVDQHYRNKYRSLLFNLKSAKNQHLFCKVILGSISPKRLVQMSALELAPEDLAEWRAREMKHALEVIEKEERETPRCCLTKFTHKGIVEINRETDEDLTFQEIFGSQFLEDENSPLEAPAASLRHCRDNHNSHVSDIDCFSDTGQMAADSEGGFKPPTDKCILKQKINVSKCLQLNTVYSGGGERRLQEDRAVSSSFPKKHLRAGNRSRTLVIWKGLIQMFSLKQFAAKAYPVSGSGYHLFQALPDLLQSRGCIVPEDVWAYLDSVWPANTKEMALIWFHPSLTKGSNPYNMLYSYLNNKQRYGIVDCNQMEMFMVPLAAYQPVPSKLHPLGGPGLDPCHPSLLLGLILPKRPAMRAHPLPKTKRKSITFKDSVEIQYFSLPSQVDACQMQPPPPPLPLSEPLWECNCPAAVLLRHEPLFSEEPVGEMANEGLSSLHHETPGGGTGPSLVDVILQLQCDSPCLPGEPGNLTLGTLGAQSQQAGIGSNPDPFHAGDPLGLLLPSEAARPDPRGMHGAHWANLLDASHLLNMLCPEGVPPAEASKAPFPPGISGATPAAEDTNSLAEEALSLVHYVTQLQSQIAPDQEPPLQPAVLYPSLGVPPEIASALSTVVAGLELPAVQQSDDSVHAQLQLLLSSLQGQTPPPSI